MATSEAQKRANARYQKQSVRQMSLKFAPPEYDLLNWIKAQGNASGYLKGLVRADMARRQQADDPLQTDATREGGDTHER